MARTRRSMTSIAAVGVAAAVALGVGGAIAQQDATTTTGTDPDSLLERLERLEAELPVEIAPSAVAVALETGVVSFEGDAITVRATLETLEPELRQLFIDADGAPGDVADAVALVGQGWLDIWTGSASLGAAESNDLAFPTDATDDLGVAAGADSLRGSTETGLRLVRQGHVRLLEGYGSLRALNAAEPSGQARFDDRARRARDYDEQVRPTIAAALGEASSSVLVPTERFVTDAPGVRSRATSMTVACLDREALEAAGEQPPEETPALLADAEVDRDDCPGSGGDAGLPTPEPARD